MDDGARAEETARNLFAIGRYDAARQKAAVALAADPQRASVHVLLARIAYESGDSDAALEAIRVALALDPTVDALHVASVVHRSLRSFDDAIRLTERAIQLQPDAAILRVSKTLTLVGPFFGETPSIYDADEHASALDEARQSARRAAELDPLLANAPYSLALCHLVTGDLPGAADALSRSLELDPESAEAHLVMGQTRARQGMSKLASRHLAAAGRLDPTDQRATSTLRSMTARRVTYGGPVAFAVIVGVVMIPAGVALALTASAVSVAVSLLAVRLVSWRNAGTPDERVRVVPEARRILDADSRMRR